MSAPLAALVLTGIGATPLHARSLAFEARVRAQAAIERAYYSHQIGATKPFEEELPREVLESRVRLYLKQSVALEELWQTPVTARMLQREVERMAQGTPMPERLRELFDLLGNDPFLIEECLARQVLVNRLVRNFFAFDPRIHAEARRQAEALRDGLASGRIDPALGHPARRVTTLIRKQATAAGRSAEVGGDSENGIWESDEREAFVVRVVLERDPGHALVASYTFPKRSWEDWWKETGAGFDERRVSVAAGKPHRSPS